LMLSRCRSAPAAPEPSADRVKSSTPECRHCASNSGSHVVLASVLFPQDPSRCKGEPATRMVPTACRRSDKRRSHQGLGTSIPRAVTRSREMLAMSVLGEP
jgi:hypothetical protein